MTKPTIKAAVHYVAANAAERIDERYQEGQTVAEWLYDIHAATKNLEAQVDNPDFKAILDPLVELVATVLAASFDMTDKADTQGQIVRALDAGFGGDEKDLLLATTVSRWNAMLRRTEIVGTFGTVLAHFEAPHRNYVLKQVIERSLQLYGFRQV